MEAFPPCSVPFEDQETSRGLSYEASWKRSSMVTMANLGWQMGKNGGRWSGYTPEDRGLKGLNFEPMICFDLGQSIGPSWTQLKKGCSLLTLQ